MTQRRSDPSYWPSCSRALGAAEQDEAGPVAIDSAAAVEAAAPVATVYVAVLRRGVEEPAAR